LRLQAARDPDISIPPLKVPLVYGMACSIQFLLPAAYWYAAFYAGKPDHFEAAVLAAVNSGGNNMARAALTGALVGAMVGQSGASANVIHCAPA
jgi:ADP-ribosylglycohydrolase